ncbi:MAG TPA: LAGLIDADG family homing endonuclease [Candidatus Saccharimonadales bacterium]|nr:LAGLIDADG family homing endonuclease [Candidatus Saccharimonadales bacterium]
MRYKTANHKPIVWSPEFSYCIGLIATDGCLSSDNRHIDFTSKDYELAEIFRNIIKPSAIIGKKRNGQGAFAYRVQFSDVSLYDFLLKLGLTPRKSKTLGRLLVPDEFYADFLRGCWDGDGSSNGYWDRRWRSSFMYYMSLASASTAFLEWIRYKNTELIEISAPAIKEYLKNDRTYYVLSYAKKDSRKLFEFIYYAEGLPFLKRKHNKMLKFFMTDPASARVSGEIR